MWSRKVPAVDGWYWMRFKDKRSVVLTQPGYVCHLGIGIFVRSGCSDWSERHTDQVGGLKDAEGVDDSIQFGPLIEEPL